MILAKELPFQITIGNTLGRFSNTLSKIGKGKTFLASRDVYFPLSFRSTNDPMLSIFPAGKTYLTEAIRYIGLAETTRSQQKSTRLLISY